MKSRVLIVIGFIVLLLGLTLRAEPSFIKWDWKPVTHYQNGQLILPGTLTHELHCNDTPGEIGPPYEWLLHISDTSAPPSTQDMTSLVDGRKGTYFCALTARSMHDEPSEFSNEVSFEVTALSLGLIPLAPTFLSAEAAVVTVKPPGEPPEAGPGIFFVSNVGADSNDGTLLDPWQTITKVNGISLESNAEVRFRGGDTFNDTDLIISDSGTSGNPITISSYGTGRAIIIGAELQGDFIVVDGVDFDHEEGGTRVLRVRGDDITIQNFKLSNATADGIDIRGGATRTVIQDGEIFHLLAGTFGSGDDAHGIGIRAGSNNTVDVTVRRMSIHEVSGDSIQADPDRSSTDNWTINLTIEDANQFWTQPLAANFNAGWSAGDSPGENAIDTKSDGGATQVINLTIDDMITHGFTDIAEVSNRTPFNLKERIVATLNRLTVYNNEHCFRLRGGGGFGNADITIKNAVVYDCGNGMRVEDALDNLQVYNSTFGDGITTFLQEVTGGIDTGEDLRNNVFFDAAVPGAFSDATNVQAVSADFLDEPNDNYQLVDTATTLVGQGATIAAVTDDRDGAARIVPYEIGAYEGSVMVGEHVFYDTLVARSDLHTAVAFRSQADVDAHLSGGPDPDADYDAVEDAMRFTWPANSGNNVDQARVDITPNLSTGNVFVTWEQRCGPNWAADGLGGSINGIGTHKNFQYSDGGLQLEVRRKMKEGAVTGDDPPAGSAGSVDIRSYFGAQGGPTSSSMLTGILAPDFFLDTEVWARYFLFIEYGGNGKVSLWVTQPGDAPQAIYLQAPGDSSGDPGTLSEFWFEHNSSQTYTGGTSYVWDRNFVVLDGVADLTEAQSLVTQGSLE